VPIALVLPLESPTFGRAAEAVKAGFTTAADAEKAKYVVIGHADGEVRAAFDKAREAGARVIVGPLLRDDVRVIVAAAAELPPTIALNQLDDTTALPSNIYTMPLGLDSEGVQLARRLRDDGAQVVVVIGSDAPLQKRFASAFAGEWVLLGGAPPVTFRFDRAPDMLALLKREFIRAKADAVVLALDAQNALLVKPYLGQVPAYTSSQVNERQPRETLRDLDGVRFVEIPWLADPSSPVFTGIPRRDYPSTSLERLYALGVDAARVALAFAGGAPATLEFDGATGHVRLDASHQFMRDAVLLQFQDGEIVHAATR
jgi:outer membrane PBP1 activator LpoA protein